MSLLLGVLAWVAIPFVLAVGEQGSALLGFQAAVSAFGTTMVLFWTGLVLVAAGGMILAATTTEDP